MDNSYRKHSKKVQIHVELPPKLRNAFQKKAATEPVHSGMNAVIRALMQLYIDGEVSV